MTRGGQSADHCVRKSKNGLTNGRAVSRVWSAARRVFVLIWWCSRDRKVLVNLWSSKIKVHWRFCSWQTDTYFQLWSVPLCIIGSLWKTTVFSVLCRLSAGKRSFFHFGFFKSLFPLEVNSLKLSIGFLLRNISFLTLTSGVHSIIFALFLRFNLSSSYDEVSVTETFLLTYCWFARDVTAAMLVVKNKSISLLWELNSIFM